MDQPPAVLDRYLLVKSLAELGRFAEAATYSAEGLRIAEVTRHAYAVGQAHNAAHSLHLLKGDWAKACALSEQGIAVLRLRNASLLPFTIAASAWASAQLGATAEALDRLGEGQQLREASEARGVVGNRGWRDSCLGRASLLLGRVDEARSLAERVVEYSSRHRGWAAHALHLLGDISVHPDRFDAESGEAYYGQALAIAAPRGMRPSSPTATVVSASSSCAQATARRRRSTSPPRRRCTARWTCSSGSDRRRPR